MDSECLGYCEVKKDYKSPASYTMVGWSISRPTHWFLVIMLAVAGAFWVAADRASASHEHIFEDIKPNNHVLGQVVHWAYDEGISKGCATERFCPDRLATQRELAVFLFRITGVKLEGDRRILTAPDAYRMLQQAYPEFDVLDRRNYLDTEQVMRCDHLKALNPLHNKLGENVSWLSRQPKPEEFCWFLSSENRQTDATTFTRADLMFRLQAIVYDMEKRR